MIKKLRYAVATAMALVISFFAVTACYATDRPKTEDNAIVIRYFYKPNCPYCKKVTPYLEGLLKTYSKEGKRVQCIWIDTSIESNRALYKVSFDWFFRNERPENRPFFGVPAVEIDYRDLIVGSPNILWDLDWSINEALEYRKMRAWNAKKHPIPASDAS